MEILASLHPHFGRGAGCFHPIASSGAIDENDADEIRWRMSTLPVESSAEAIAG
jgi:hypothetical protein